MRSQHLGNFVPSCERAAFPQLQSTKLSHLWAISLSSVSHRYERNLLNTKKCRAHQNAGEQMVSTTQSLVILTVLLRNQGRFLTTIVRSVEIPGLVIYSGLNK